MKWSRKARGWCRDEEERRKEKRKIENLDNVLLLGPVGIALNLTLGLELLNGIPMLPSHLGSHASQVSVAAARSQAVDAERLGDHHALLLVEGGGHTVEHLREQMVDGDSERETHTC